MNHTLDVNVLHSYWTIKWHSFSILVKWQPWSINGKKDFVTLLSLNLIEGVVNFTRRKSLKTPKVQSETVYRSFLNIVFTNLWCSLVQDLLSRWQLNSVLPIPVYAFEFLIRFPCRVGPNLQLSDHGIFEDILGHPALRQPGKYPKKKPESRQNEALNFFEIFWSTVFYKVEDKCNN